MSGTLITSVVRTYTQHVLFLLLGMLNYYGIHLDWMKDKNSYNYF